MAEFKEELVINALHPEKAEVGKKYWFADTLLKLKQVVEDCDISRLGTCSALSKYSDMLFIKDSKNGWEYIYPYEETQNQRMTRIQFMEWVSKGNGMYRYKNGGRNCYAYESCLEEKLNDEVDEGIVIRTWDSEEWQEPLYSIYKRDVLGEKED